MKKVINSIVNKVKDLFSNWELGTVNQAWKH